MNEKQKIIALLQKHINSRSGIDYRNYGSRQSFMADYRRILSHGRDARELLRAVEWRYSITAEALREAFRSAYSGRLALSDDGSRLEYCADQYYATEYRAAACAVLSSALWAASISDYKDGDSLRAYFRREFGRGIASRWFN